MKHLLSTLKKKTYEWWLGCAFILLLTLTGFSQQSYAQSTTLIVSGACFTGNNSFTKDVANSPTNGKDAFTNGTLYFFWEPNGPTGVGAWLLQAPNSGGGPAFYNTSNTSVLPTTPVGNAGGWVTINYNGGGSCSGSGPLQITLAGGGSTPTITAGTAAGTITACAGTASANTRSFTVSGSNLTANIVAAAPTNFQISINASTGFASSLTLTQSSGTVSTTTVYVRSAPTAPASSISGSVTLTSTGATAQTVAVSGTVTALPNVSISPASPTLTQGSTGTLTANGANSFLWSANAGSAATTSVTVNAAGTYSVTGTSNGCSGTASAVVSVTQAAAVSPCVYTPATINIAYVGGGTLGFSGPSYAPVPYTPDGMQNNAPKWSNQFGYVLRWSNTRWEILDGNYVAAYNTTGSITNLPCAGWTVDANYGNVITVTGGCGSLLPPSLTITATPSLTIASGNSVTLAASGASTYTWSNGNMGASINFVPTSSTTLSVTGITGTNCSLTGTAAVSVTGVVLNVQNLTNLGTVTLGPGNCPGAISFLGSGRRFEVTGPNSYYKNLPQLTLAVNRSITVNSLRTTGQYTIKVYGNTGQTPVLFTFQVNGTGCP